MECGKGSGLSPVIVPWHNAAKRAWMLSFGALRADFGLVLQRQGSARVHRGGQPIALGGISAQGAMADPGVAGAALEGAEDVLHAFANRCDERVALLASEQGRLMLVAAV